ncbi:MAG: hypothetical protein H5U03_08210 [Clostridia bacterium]|nr:hypothetical protein [Clostridia bacterium]
MAVSLDYMRQKLLEWTNWRRETVNKMPPRQLYAVYRKYAARQVEKAKKAAVKASQPQYRQLALQFPEEVKEVKPMQSKKTISEQKNTREIAREELKKEVLRLARGILDKKGWPRVKTHWRLAWGEIVQDRTPGQGFLRAVIKLSKGTLTLIESNPQKVTNARDKVMLYWEAPGVRRVGQVRRTQKSLEVVWFD